MSIVHYVQDTERLIQYHCEKQELKFNKLDLDHLYRPLGYAAFGNSFRIESCRGSRFNSVVAGVTDECSRDQLELAAPASRLIAGAELGSQPVCCCVVYARDALILDVEQRIEALKRLQRHKRFS